jgi:hypothetical protein
MIDYNKYFGVIYDVDLTISPQKRWSLIAEELHDEIVETVTEVMTEAEGFADDYLRYFSPFYQNIIRVLISGGIPVIGTLYRMFGEEYVREIESVAKLVDISFSKLLLCNLSYDISQYSKYHYACSSFSFNLRGAPLLARTMDWVWPDTLGHHTIVVRFHKKKHQYYAITFPGFVGVLSVISPKKWAMTVNMAPQVISPKVIKWPALMLTRAACDNSKSYSSLVINIAKRDTQTSFFVHIIGIKKDEHCIIEKEPGYYRIRRNKLPLIQTNHFVDDEDRNPSEGLESDIIYYDSFPRYKSLNRRLKKLPDSLKDTMKHLSGMPVTNERTMQSMVFYPKSGRWLLKVRPI